MGICDETDDTTDRTKVVLLVAGSGEARVGLPIVTKSWCISLGLRGRQAWGAVLIFLAPRQARPTPTGEQLAANRPPARGNGHYRKRARLSARDGRFPHAAPYVSTNERSQA